MDSKIIDCGTLCTAARRLSMGLRYENNRYEFVDHQTGVIIHGETSLNRQYALLSASKSLNDYFSPQVVTK